MTNSPASRVADARASTGALVTSRFPPAIQHGLNVLGRERSSLERLKPLSQQLVIAAAPVPDMRAPGQSDRCLVDRVRRP